MSQEIQYIFNQHNEYVTSLKKIILSAIINTIEDYCNGFVNYGQLFTNTVYMRNFSDTRNFDKYISFKIKYVHNLYFFDFWRISHHDWSGDFYGKNWIMSHYNYIYKDGKLLRDKINFIINDTPGEIKYFNPSYPIYDLKKLSQEYFVEFQCSPEWIKKVNTMCKKVNTMCKKINSQKKINNLFTLFKNLTENEDDEFYENHKLFNYFIK
jgi:hypothetical protein